MNPRAEFVSNKLWIYINGKTFVFEPESKQKKRSSNSVEAENEIVAPMPGKITSIKFTVGNTIKKDDVLIVMEAMKMEYNLKAPRDAVIDKITCQAGNQVNLGDVLVCLK